MWIFFWIIRALFWSIRSTYRKKTVDTCCLWKNLLAIFWPTFWLFIIFILLIFSSWINKDIFNNYLIISIILLRVIIDIIGNYLEIYILKNTKISFLLPYQNLDKLLVIFIWFFIYKWTNNWTSIESFLITVFTIFLILFFSINKRNLNIDKKIFLYIFRKILLSIDQLLLWYVLLKCSTITYISINNTFLFLIYLTIILIVKDKINTLLTQSREFYKNIFLTLIFWWTNFLISLLLIEKLWLLTTTLISFLWLVFSIFSIKIILKETPTKKQIILAFLVLILIWMWYYFK